MATDFLTSNQCPKTQTKYVNTNVKHILSQKISSENACAKNSAITSRSKIMPCISYCTMIQKLMANDTLQKHVVPNNPKIKP